MATIKSYSDLKQSKVLSKILSDDSADMVYIASANDDIGDTLYTAEYKSEIIIKEGDTDYINCWSLAALLSVLPKHIGSSVLRMDMSENDFNLWFEDLSGTVDEILPDITKYNPIDACYEMILKLNELKML
jgi:hypothetical protein